MPLTEAEAQQLSAAGRRLARRTADLRAAENEQHTARMLGKPVSDVLRRDTEKRRTALRNARDRFDGLIDDLKETP